MVLRNNNSAHTESKPFRLFLGSNNRKCFALVLYVPHVRQLFLANIFYFSVFCFFFVFERTFHTVTDKRLLQYNQSPPQLARRGKTRQIQLEPRGRRPRPPPPPNFSLTGRGDPCPLSQKMTRHKAACGGPLSLPLSPSPPAPPSPSLRFVQPFFVAKTNDPASIARGMKDG